MRINLFTTIFVTLFLPFNLFADDQSVQTETIGLTDLESEPSILVGGCVNAITGGFVHHRQDMVVPGPIPLKVESMFVSNAVTDEITGWFIGGSAFMTFYETENMKNPQIFVEDPFEPLPLFKFEGEYGPKGWGYFKPHFKKGKPGFTNIAKGLVSGRTNIKNQTLRHHPTGRGFMHKNPAGVWTVYSSCNMMQQGRNYVEYFRPTHKVFPNGISIKSKYTNGQYHPSDIYMNNRYTTWILQNKKQEDLCSIAFHEHGRPGFNGLTDMTYIFFASDGRKALYTGEQLTKHLIRYTLNSPESYPTTIDFRRLELSWCKKKQGVPTRIAWSDDRWKEIKYYQQEGYERCPGEPVIIIDTHDDCRLGKVKSLCGPSPAASHGVPDLKPITTHCFYYIGRNGEEYFTDQSNGGRTTVFDAENRKTKYFYGEGQRLLLLNRYEGSGPWKIATRERLYWGVEEERGQIISRTFETNKFKILFCRYYYYDRAGNATKVAIAGNLTGKNQAKILLGKDKRPLANGCEEYYKKYRYNRENLMISQEDPFLGTVEKYTYYPNTDLVKRKLLLADNKIRLREFYEYDDNSMVCLEIKDDGETTDSDNLQGVTQRTIKRIQNTTIPPIGLPEVMEELYLDTLSGNEVLLKKIVNKYNAYGKILSQDHYGADGVLAYTLTKEYDEKGRVIKETDPLGQTTTREYDRTGNVIWEQGPDKTFSTFYTYNSEDNICAVTKRSVDGKEFTTTCDYDICGRKIASHDVFGNQTAFVLDDFSREIGTIKPAIRTKDGNWVRPTIHRQFDLMGNVIYESDPCGNVTQNTYNVYGKPITTIHPDGTTEAFEYTLNGLLCKSTDRNGCTTHYEYDYKARPTKTQVFDADGVLQNTCIKEYNFFHLLREVDNAGHEKTYSYDGAGRLIREINENARVDILYDALGRKVEEREFYGSGEHDYLSRHLSYDLLDRVIKETLKDASGNTVDENSFLYNESGKVIQTVKMTQAGPAVTTTTYDMLGDITSVTDPEGKTTYTQTIRDNSDENGSRIKLLKTTTPDGCVTILKHDTHGNPSTFKKLDPMGKVIQSYKNTYDKCGNLVKRTDTVIAAGHESKRIVTRWAYDSMRRPIHVIQAFGTPEQLTTQTIYNGKGQKASELKPDGTSIDYDYDPLGRLARLSSSDRSINYSYSYDLNNNPVHIHDNVYNLENTREYDRNNRLVRETCGNGITIEYTYDRMGRPLAILLPDQSQATYSYKDGFLEQVSKVSPVGETLYTHFYSQYEYGSIAEELRIGTCGAAKYERDIIGRAKKFSSEIWTEEITSYDLNGNLVARKITDSKGTQSYSYKYDHLHQLAAETGHTNDEYICDSLYNRVEKNGTVNKLNSLNQLLESGETQYTYDLNGNCIRKITPKSTTNYHYDALNRLIQVEEGNHAVCYLYDDKNRRLSKTIGNHSQPEERYLYFEQNEVGCINPQGHIKQFRLLGIGLGAEIGASVAIELAGKVYSPFHDHNGNIVALQDAQTGRIIETYRYTAFGEEHIYDESENQVEEAINPWRFSSKRHDPETGFIYFGRRHYDPSTGRWMTQDPLGLEAGPNLYAYVSNNPLTHFDLYGLTDASTLDYADEEERNRHEEKNGDKATEQNIQNQVNERQPGWKKITQGVGKCLYYLSEHALPIPYARRPVAYLGHQLAEGSGKEFVTNADNPPAHWSWVGTEDRDPKIALVYACGMNNTLSDCVDKTKDISDLTGGYKVHYCYSSSNGTTFDTMKRLWIGLGGVNHEVRSCTACIKHCIKSVGGVGSNGRVVISVFSLGGVYFDSSLNNLSKEERAMVEVMTFGSAKLIGSDRGLKRAMNFICTGDPIPMISDPVGYAKAKNGRMDNVQFIKTNNWPLDHYFDHEEYRRHLRDQLDQLFMK